MELAAWLLVTPIKPGKDQVGREPCPSSSPSTVVAFELPPLCRFFPECRFEGDADDGVPFNGESLELRLGVKLILFLICLEIFDVFGIPFSGGIYAKCFVALKRDHCG